ncbi:MAG TPA: hypothetical protein VMP89_04420 [Solirubrobacteraceae bacterium]|nr:hypothetical protein [Solirubrobacteraceae bacterium]
MSHHQGLPGSYRELDQRTADGLTVTLAWNPATAALRVVVADRETEAVSVAVRAQDASDAFMHPFAYAGRTVSEVRESSPLASTNQPRRLGPPSASRGGTFFR